MATTPSDMTPAVDLTVERGTGPVRSRRAAYVDLMPPCNNACPAGENIQRWLAHAQAGAYHPAWEALTSDNPLPAVMGRVCYHPCETSCNRAQIDSPVSIHAIERFLGDLANRENWSFAVAPATGKRVLIVGAGPSGLSAAYHLARLGHSVEIHEAGPIAGGMMYFGIPAYRMPRAELERDVQRIAAMGVKIITDHKVTDLSAEMREGSFDAAFLAIGAGVGKRINIPARDAAKVLDAVSLLHETSAGTPPLLGRRVIVYGGGNTAMDAARTARRLGATEALIVYRRDRAHMSAHAFEADEALAEGVKIKWLSTIKRISGTDLTVERMELDAAGRPQATGEIETLSADAVVLALGQETDSRFLADIPGVEFAADGAIKVGSNMMTGHPGVFAGGDMVPGQQSATIAIGHGKRAARNIDAYLRGTVWRHPDRPIIVEAAMLHLPVYSDAEPAQQQVLEAGRRLSGFEEVTAGLSQEEARHEAQRCYSCGNCYECDQCYAACPEQAIVKLGPGLRYRIEDAKCNGCSICFDQCPCHAIEMIPEIHLHE